MENSNIEPAKITKPIQLLAAWLVGLVSVNASFLATATSSKIPEWLMSWLIFACILNVPIFLLCIFLLQTKFRPQMQEDSYYAKYLESNTGKTIIANGPEIAIQQLKGDLLEVNNKSSELISGLETAVKDLAIQMQVIASASNVQNETKLQITQIVEEAKQSIETSIIDKNSLENSRLNVEMNDLLPDFREIRAHLRKYNIRVSKTFGSTSTNPEIPKKRIIGFGAKIPFQRLKTILNIAYKHNFEGIHFSEEEFNEGKIYIGSYIYRVENREMPYALLNDQFRELLNSPGVKEEDIVQYIEDNSI